MDYLNEWYLFPSSIDKSICNRIKKLATNKWNNASIVLDPLDKRELTKEERKNRFCNYYRTNRRVEGSG